MDTIIAQQYHSGQSSYNNSLTPNSGFTLLELITTLAVFAIITSIGIPALQAFASTNRLAVHINSFVGAMAFTRSEAIKRNQYVVICKSDNQLTCNKKTQWHAGWIIYEDINRNRKRDDEETLLRVQSRFSGGLTLVYQGLGTSNYVTYRPSGYTLTNGTFTFCDPRRPDTAKALILVKSGRLRKSKLASNGDPLVCPSIQ